MAHANNNSKPLGVLDRVLGFLSPNTSKDKDDITSPLRTRSHLIRSPPIAPFETSVLDSDNEEQSTNDEPEVDNNSLENEKLASPQITGTPVSDTHAHSYFLRAGSKKQSTIKHFRASLKKLGEAKQQKKTK